MAVLQDSDRALVAALMNRDAIVMQGMTILKADLRAAIDAVDGWVDSNSTAFNTAIPQPARGALSSSQKAALLLYVVKRRYEIS